MKNTRVKTKSAPGPDGLTRKDYGKIPKGVLLYIFNLIMWTEKLPESLLAFRTILIPKKGYEKEPDKYRPITIPSVIVRGLHIILANRLEQMIPIDKRQRGFRSEIDGCRDNIFQLDFILKQCYQNFESLYMVSVDIAKAFPSVSHPALIEALHSFGIPAQFINYISNVYRKGFTILQGQGWV